MSAEVRMSGTERRKQIIDVAMKVFSQKGFKGTTIKDIARKAGVSDATLFKHFPDKKTLYETIMKESMGTRSKPKGGASLDIEFSLSLKKIAHMIISNNEKDQTFIRMMLYASLEEHRFAESFIEKNFYKDIEFISDRIEQGIETSEYRKVNARIAAHTFISMISGYCIAQYVMGLRRFEDFDVDDVAEHFVTIFLNGLKK